MPSATPQPQLKKKASLRERLKAWQKPGEPLEIVTDEPKPRFVYEPKHAAADFSRLAVSPVSPARPRFAPPMQPLCEDGVPTFRRPSQPGQRNGDDDDRPPKDEKPTRRLSRHGSQRHSYAVAEDPFQASNTAAHVPVNSRPVAWTPTAQAAEQKKQDPAPPSQPLSDYELFIARAEAEDRERRERILQSISQRSAAYSANRVKPDPHRQFASVGSSSAGRTSDTSQQRNGSNRYVPGSGNGGDEQKKQRQQAGKGHGWRPSWASSYATGGSGPERGLEKDREEARHVPSPPRAQPQQRRSPESGSVQQPPVVYGVDEKFGQAGEYRPQPPRTLRRQASLTKRIVDYIRPPKTAARPVETVFE